jgi:uncharacterized cofD-like protein
VTGYFAGNQIAVTLPKEADWVVLGPGSWYTSVIPHLMVPDQREALVCTAARVLVTMNLEAQDGETGGYTPLDHLAALHEHAPDLRVHTVLVDPTAIPDPVELESALASWGVRLVVADVARSDGTPRHDPEKLAAAYSAILAGGDSRVAEGD